MNRLHSPVSIPCGIPATGAALFISLVFLLVLTILGLAGTQNTALQELMAGHLRDSDLAFEAAESALKAGEAAVASGTLGFICTSPTDGLYKNSHPGASDDCPAYQGWPSNSQASNPYSPDNEKFWTGNTDVMTLTSSQFNNLAEKPKYVIEILSSGAASPVSSLEILPVSSGNTYYRITAHGVGRTRNSVAVTQSVVRQ